MDREADSNQGSLHLGYKAGEARLTVKTTYTGSRVFGPSRAKVALLAAVLFAAAVACYSVGLRDKPPSLFLWFLCGMFCVVAIGVVVSTVSGYPRLTLNAQGLEFATLLNATHYDWTDLQDFYVMRMLGWRVIAFKYSPSYRGWRMARFVSRRTVGFEGIYPGVFSASLDEICDEMRAFCRRRRNYA
jgi:hypothetical protein